MLLFCLIFLQTKNKHKNHCTVKTNEKKIENFFFSIPFFSLCVDNQCSWILKRIEKRKEREKHDRHFLIKHFTSMWHFACHLISVSFNWKREFNNFICRFQKGDRDSRFMSQLFLPCLPFASRRSTKSVFITGITTILSIKMTRRLQLALQCVSHPSLSNWCTQQLLHLPLKANGRRLLRHWERGKFWLLFHTVKSVETWSLSHLIYLGFQRRICIKYKVTTGRSEVKKRASDKFKFHELSLTVFMNLILSDRHERTHKTLFQLLLLHF